MKFFAIFALALALTTALPQPSYAQDNPLLGTWTDTNGRIFEFTKDSGGANFLQIYLSNGKPAFRAGAIIIKVTVRNYDAYITEGEISGDDVLSPAFFRCRNRGGHERCEIVDTLETVDMIIPPTDLTRTSSHIDPGH